MTTLGETGEADLRRCSVESRLRAIGLPGLESILALFWVGLLGTGPMPLPKTETLDGSHGPDGPTGASGKDGVERDEGEL